MANAPSSTPLIRRSLGLLFALPVLAALGVVGFLVYRRAAHLPPPQRVISSQPFASEKLDNLTVNLFTQGDVLHPMGNDLYIDFRDAQGQLTNVGAVTFELSLSMPGMVMHSIGKVFPTSTPGRYRTMVEPQMAGEWSAFLAFTNAGKGDATNFSLTVK